MDSPRINSRIGLGDWTAKQIEDPCGDCATCRPWRRRRVRSRRGSCGQSWGYWCCPAPAWHLRHGACGWRRARRIAPVTASLPVFPPSGIWKWHRRLVRCLAGGKNSRFETYSNGLRIDSEYAVSHRARAYVAFSLLDSTGRAVKRALSRLVLFITLQKASRRPSRPARTPAEACGESLLDYVRRRRCYNFIIDRFGRVYAW